MITTTSKVATLEREREGIHAKLKRLRESTRQKENDLCRELYRINAAIDREKALSWIGQEVRFKYSVPVDDPQCWLNTATGTLVAVRRSRGTVDFGERGTWNLKLDEIQHVDDTAERGIVLH